MTIEHFLKFHGEQWSTVRNSPMWKDLVDVLRTCDPARSMPAVSSVDATENAQHLLGRIAGFNLAINLMEAGIVTEPQAEVPEVTYTQEPTDD